MSQTLSKSLIIIVFLFAAAIAHADEGTRFGVGAGILGVGNAFTGAPLVLEIDTGPVLIDVYGGMALATSADGSGDEDFGVIAGASAHFVVHSTDSSDFSVGGGAGLLHLHVDGETDDALLLDGGVRIRLFLVPNVALTAGAGVAALFQEGSDVVTVGGRLIGNAGVVYFF